MFRLKRNRLLIVSLVGFLVASICFLPANVFAVVGAGFKLSPGLEFSIPAYSTKVEASSWLYCDSFGWAGSNASSFELSNVFISSGVAVEDLAVGVSGANLTFNDLGASKCSFDLDYSGVGANVSLVGFGDEPAEVIADGVLTSNYTYTASSDSLVMTTEASNVVINYAVGEDWGVAGLAIGLIGFVIGVSALAIVMVKRHGNNDDGD